MKIKICSRSGQPCRPNRGSAQQDQTLTWTRAKRAYVAKAMASILSPFRNTYRYLVCLQIYLLISWIPLTIVVWLTQQRQAHESPVLFYSVVLGLIGPVLAFGVPPVRERLGYRPPEPIPTTYPSGFFVVHVPSRG